MYFGFLHRAVDQRWRTAYFAGLLSAEAHDLGDIKTARMIWTSLTHSAPNDEAHVVCASVN